MKHPMVSAEDFVVDVAVAQIQALGNLVRVSRGQTQSCGIGANGEGLCVTQQRAADAASPMCGIDE